MTSKDFFKNREDSNVGYSMFGLRREWITLVFALVTLIFWGALVPRPDMSQLVIFDICIVFVILFVTPPDDEILLFLFLLLSYYSIPFPLTISFDIVDLRSTAVPMLENEGLRPDLDLPRYELASLLFKYSLLLVYFLATTRSTPIRWERPLGGLPKVETYILMFTLVGSYVAGKVTGNTLFFQVFRFTTAQAALVFVFLPKTTFARFLSLVALTGFSFLLTRSRHVMAIGALGLLADQWSRTKRMTPQMVVSVTFAFLAASLYGVFRVKDSNVSIGDALVGYSQFEASGESGVMFQVGAHVIGLKDANMLPPCLIDSTLDKLLRVIPLFPGKSQMLADRYAQYFFPEISSYGGGYAFSGVAEAYIFGGLPVVVAYGAILALIHAILRKWSDDGYWRIVLITICLNLTRSEFSVTLITIMWGTAWVLIVRGTVRLVASRLASIVSHSVTP